MKSKPVPEGWVSLGARPRRYRYRLENGEVLMVVQFSPRKWYYGQGQKWAKKGWQAWGKESNQDRAFAAAMAHLQTIYDQTRAPWICRTNPRPPEKTRG